MMSHVTYADSNIYRYLSSGELELTTIGDVRLAYSHVHFEEMIRGGNTQALEGMELVRAVPMQSNEDKKFEVDGLGVCFEYQDPTENYHNYKSSLVGLDSTGEDGLYELLIRFMGADNMEELRKIPNTILEVAHSVQEFDSDGTISKKAKKAAEEIEQHLNGDLKIARPITKTREAFGFKKGANSIAQSEINPIDSIWEHMESYCPSVSKGQFFGFESIAGSREEVSYSDGIVACHLILNMVGFSPDKGLAKRDKIRNIISDGQHLALASMCSEFLTTDERLYNKARAIFTYKGIKTKLHLGIYKRDGMAILLHDPESIKRFKIETSCIT